MTSKFTREELLNIIETDHVQCGEASALARMALAAMDSEPVVYASEETLAYAAHGELLVKVLSQPAGDAIIPLYRHAQPAKGLDLAGWQFKSVNGDWLGLIDEHGKNQAVREGCEVREVFAMADGVNDRDQVRREHAEWSQTTFGNVGPIGPLKHLSKEALEAAAEPGDLSEWADMQFLLWDAQRRAGITDEQITQAMIEKLAVNKQREWPEPKDGEPRLHIKEQPAPVVDADDNFYSWFGREWAEHYQHNQYTTTAKQMLGVMAESAWKAGRRAAMLQAQSDDDGEPTDDERIMAIEGIHNCERCSDDGWIVGEMGITRCACGQAGTLTNEGTKRAGNSPVIPDGWTGNDKANAALMMLDRIETVDPVDDDRIDGIKRIVRELAAGPQEVKGEHQIRDEMDMGARITSHRFKV